VKRLVLERVKIDTLQADAENARLHDRRNLDAIKTSLERFGQTRPLVATPEGLVIAGNGTLAAALELGWDEINVTRVPFRNPAEARAFALADNRSSELAQWNQPVLMQALESLALEGWKLESIGFTPEDLAAWKRRQDPQPPDDFPAFDDDLETAYLCPRCSYEWSGRPE
jgi:ParB-like chromosome segregation protein Spo0J